MDKALKQRLIGAFALVALAVVFLPVLLDGSGHEARLDMKRAIPPEPQFPQPEPIRQTTLAVPESSSGQTASTSAQARATSVPEPVVNQSREPPQQRTEARPVAPAAPAPAATQPPSRTQVPPQTQAQAGWVVQVGSFSQEANARRESERLIDAGFKAFVESAQAGGRTVYRVKLGPEAERRRAEQIRDRLREQGGVTGIVMSHP